MKKKRLKKDAKDRTLAVPDRTDARVGSICVSMAGHDAGLLLAVVAGIDRNHVLTADGKTRKLDAPKKKKMRHLSMITNFPRRTQRRSAQAGQMTASCEKLCPRLISKASPN